MFRYLSLLLVVQAVVAQTWENPLERNLAYRSPFEDHPQVSWHYSISLSWFTAAQFDLNTREIHRRHVNAFQKRQTTPASKFSDDHYPTFYGGDFSNALFIWNAGINFTHAVASGDPFPDSVLLWTRAVPLPSKTPTNPSTTPFLPDQEVPVCVKFEIVQNQKDFGGKSVVDSGTAFTSADVDWTVKVRSTPAIG